ncbi:hypothetical protein LXL04_012305 [Taraxacum kok-saghyz]
METMIRIWYIFISWFITCPFTTPVGSSDVAAFEVFAPAVMAVLGLLLVSCVCLYVVHIRSIPVRPCGFHSPDLPISQISGLTYAIQVMGLWTLLEGCLLMANALAVLNEDRFLSPRGWSFQEYSGVKRNSLKGQIIGLIYATQYLRVILIMLNSLCIVVKLVSG